MAPLFACDWIVRCSLHQLVWLVPFGLSRPSNLWHGKPTGKEINQNCEVWEFCKRDIPWDGQWTPEWLRYKKLYLPLSRCITFWNFFTCRSCMVTKGRAKAICHEASVQALLVLKMDVGPDVWQAASSQTYPSFEATCTWIGKPIRRWWHSGH